MSRGARITVPLSRHAPSTPLWSGSGSSSALARQLSHVLIPARPKYIPKSTSSSLFPDPSLALVEYGGPKMQISSRTVSRGQVRFQLSRIADGACPLYPEDVPLERLFDFITPEELQKFENEQYAVEEEQEKLRMANRRRGRPLGLKKKPTTTRPSTQAGSRKTSTRPSSSKQLWSSITSETDPLQRDSERGTVERAPPQTSHQDISSSGASILSTRSRRSEELNQGRYQMLPPTPRRTLQPRTTSPTTSTAPLKTGKFLILRKKWFPLTGL